MIDYVGDVSRRDALLLREFAECSQRILEFGAGASTQILASYGLGRVTSVETDPAWIAKTERNLTRLGAHRPVTFRAYAGFEPSTYDLIFIDGLWKLRADFAFATWPALTIGGAMLFHDTRRPKDVRNVCALLERYATEIDRVVLNRGNSNITVVIKREPLLLEDYNAIEGRTPEQLGLA